MPPCRCTDTCACVIQGSGGVDVTGSGTAGNPYVIDGAGIGAGLVGNHQTGLGYSLVIADANKAIEADNAAPFTLAIPTHAAQAIPVHSVIVVYQMGAGQVTVVPDVGVTLHAPNGAKSALQFSMMTLWKRATNEWVLSGDTTT